MASSKTRTVMLSKFDYWNMVLIGVPLVAMAGVIYRDRVLKPDWERKERLAQAEARSAASSSSPSSSLNAPTSGLSLPMSTPKY
ncbi:hypothetical protein BASA81_005117 [Batrachochytrium salamandrivorans]|nr:hypothetical protein BASA81_005117 [Batrachochytrium salamandrivorans]